LPASLRLPKPSHHTKKDCFEPGCPNEGGQPSANSISRWEQIANSVTGFSHLFCGDGVQKIFTSAASFLIAAVCIGNQGYVGI
jgi:hypothetical protein